MNLPSDGSVTPQCHSASRTEGALNYRQEVIKSTDQLGDQQTINIHWCQKISEKDSFQLKSDRASRDGWQHKSGGHCTPPLFTHFATSGCVFDIAFGATPSLHISKVQLLI